MRRSSAQDMTRRPEALGWKVTGVLHSLAQPHELEIWSEALWMAEQEQALEDSGPDAVLPDELLSLKL